MTNLLGLLLLILLCCTATIALSQGGRVIVSGQQAIIVTPISQNEEALIVTAIKKLKHFSNADSGKLGIYKPFYICKQVFTVGLIKQISSPQVIVEPKAPKLLTIHGNISYDFFYRSKIDTPISQQDFQQHTERVYLNILYKEKYPLKIAFVLRQSNSPYFTNFTDINFQFDRSAFNRDFKQAILNKLSLQMPKRPDLNKLLAELKANKEELEKLKGWVSSSSTLQKIIEEREREYYKKLQGKEIPQNKANDTTLQNTPPKQIQVAADTVGNTAKLNLVQRASANNKLKNETEKLDSLRNKYTNSIDSVKNNLQKKYLDKPTKKLDSLKTKYSDSLAGIKDSLQHKLTAKKDSIQNKLSKKFEAKKDSLQAKFEKKIGNKADSLEGKFTKLYEEKKKTIDSLEKKVRLQQKKVDSLNAVVQKDIQQARQKISRATGERELKKIAAAHGINIDSMDKWQRKLAAIKSFSIGRSVLDYTELTAQNITITGLNVEYNPSYYAAFAAGKIDYRFRDFFNKKSKANSQYVALGRFGWGNRDKAAVILTVFQGRKNQSNFALSDSVSGHVNLLGYSVEGIWKKDENTIFSAEFAKSTIPTGGTIQNINQTKALWNFSERSNMGINLKAQTIIPETHTKLSGFFRKTGENFQSFSLFSYNTNQTAWQARADQDFFKSRVTITGMLRRNDFTNPFTERTYTSSTVFKSILLNVRFPKYPAVSVGYYPGTQLYVVNKESIRENAYYMLNASVIYGYHYKGIGMNSSFVFNQYYNQATDSGFVLYKGVNYYLSQNIFFKKLQLQGAYSYTKQPELQYYTLESTADYSLKEFLKIGTGLKYNYVNGGNKYWGKRVMLSINFKQWGGFLLQYEKSYLPTLNQTLYPVEIGRVSWFKTF